MNHRKKSLVPVLLALAGWTAWAAQAAAEPGSSCYLGVLASRGTVEVVARSAGTLGALRVAIGDPVSPGQALARVDSPSSRYGLEEEAARLDAARTALLGAEVEVKRARRELERRQGTPELFSTEQIEAAEFQLDVSQLEQKSRQAAVAEAQAALSRVQGEAGESLLRAPFAGTVSAIYAASGSTVENGRPILQLIAGASPILRFAVPASDLHLFPVGAQVVAEAQNGSRSPQKAVVETVAPALDAASRLVFVEAGSPAEAWAGVPMGAVLRVAAVGQGPCGDQPVALLPNEPRRESDEGSSAFAQQ